MDSHEIGSEHVYLAVADGLALHAMTTHQWIGTRQLTAAIDLVLDGLIAGPKTPH